MTLSFWFFFEYSAKHKTAWARIAPVKLDISNIILYYKNIAVFWTFNLT